MLAGLVVFDWLRPCVDSCIHGHILHLFKSGFYLGLGHRICRLRGGQLFPQGGNLSIQLCVLHFQLSVLNLLLDLLNFKQGCLFPQNGIRCGQLHVPPLLGRDLLPKAQYAGQALHKHNTLGSTL